ncbi:MAG: TonB-dependent receptor [Comamonas sp.]
MKSVLHPLRFAPFFTHTAIALFLPLGAAAQASDPQLQALTVKGQTLQTSRSAYSVPTLGRDEIAAAHVSETEELWRNIPGMHVNKYQLSGVANSVILRGFSGGGHGGDVAATLDGITLNEAMSHADGYFDLNVVVPLELEEVAVHQGPVSVLQGNFNRAGLVELRTRRSGEYKEVAVQAGSDATADAQAALGFKLDEASQLFIAAQHARTDGDRPDSSNDRSTLSARWQRQINADLNVAVSGRIHEAEGDSPSYLTFAQWQVDPQGKDPRVQGDGSQKHFKTLRLDVNYELSTDTRLLAYAYGTQQDFVRWFSRPTNSTTWKQREERYERDVLGVGVNLSSKAQWLGSPVQWTVGTETLRESTDYAFWEGLQKRQRQAAADYDRNATLNNVAAFGQLAWQAHPLFQPSFGLRWDRFTGDCKRLGPETGSNPCTGMNTVSHASPKLGLTSQVHEQVTLRTSWSEGFALPSNFAKYSLGAANLEPNIFRQTEIGAQLRPSQNVWLDIAAYRMVSSQEIRNAGPDVYENFGSTIRKGFEAQAIWTPTDSLELRWIYGRAQSRVKHNGNANLIGKQVTAVPTYTSTVQARWSVTPQWSVHGAVRSVGKMAVNADNTLWSQAYNVADVGVQYRLPAAWGLKDGVLNLNVRNLANKDYASNTSVIGGTHLVAPGAPRSVMLGMNFSL